MSINAQRYGLITNEYRWRERLDGTLAATYIKAREMEIPTNLDLERVDNLLNSLFGVVGAIRRRYGVVVRGTETVNPDSFTYAPPCFIFHAPEVGANDLLVMVTRARVSENDNTTTLELWG